MTGKEWWIPSNGSLVATWSGVQNIVPLNALAATAGARLAVGSKTWTVQGPALSAMAPKSKVLGLLIRCRICHLRWSNICAGHGGISCTQNAKRRKIVIKEGLGRRVRLAERCEKLQSLGFEICHQDSDVRHKSVPDLRFDFSATDEEHFLGEALRIAFQAGLKGGANDVRMRLSALMKLED
jgi:hypothetical protein